MELSLASNAIGTLVHNANTVSGRQLVHEKELQSQQNRRFRRLPMMLADKRRPTEQLPNSYGQIRIRVAQISVLIRNSQFEM